LVNAYAAVNSVLPPPTISGLTNLCVNSSATFTVTNPPASYTWSSSGLTLVSTSGNTATFSASSNGTGWVAIKVGNVELVRKSVQIGTPAGYISGPYDLSCNCQVTANQTGNYRFSAINLTESVLSNDIEWQVATPDGFFTYLYVGANPVISFSEVGNYTVKMKWKGTCGYSPYATKNVNIQYGSGYYPYSAAYPNPASNELIIDRIEEDSSAETAAIIAQSAKGKTSEIRVLLYGNSTAQLVYNKTYSSSEKQIKIDISKLPNGIYHLNIIENGEKIKEQTIIVNH
jgi:hypothetical protein